MKTDISCVNREHFNVRPITIAGEQCWLVFPKKMGFEWEADTLIYRSSIWNSDGILISAAYKKFFNWGEYPKLVLHPSSMKGVRLLEKIDGSLLCISKYKGELIVRTRGTDDAEQLGTGDEIELFKKQYPKIFEFESYTSDYSRIFEWTTPKCRIVIDYGDVPQLWYTGKIYHDDYRYASQDELDSEYQDFGCMRPKTYKFETVEDMISSVDAFMGVEGVCAYFNHGQDIRKVKGADYLARHRFKSFATYDNTLDMFLKFNCPHYGEFQKMLIETFDYECFEMVRGYASKICDSYKEVQKIINFMERFAWSISDISSRKLQYEKIKQAYGDTNRSAFVLQILDGKKIDNEGLKKLIYQVDK